MANKNDPKSVDMTLKGYYENLPKATYPKKDFLVRVMNECDVSYTTACNWVKGHTKPVKQSQVLALSNITGIAVENLWQ
ncbi:MAG: hypothetical protein ACM679_02915 [Bacteroidales bacterium]